MDAVGRPLISARDAQVALAVVEMFDAEEDRATEAELIEAIASTYE